MPRPKANTPEGRRASEKWRQTMINKYGENGITETMRQIGSLGGRAKVPKGFAFDKERARTAGAIGGKKSRRTGISTGQGKKKEYVKVDEQFLTHKIKEPVVKPEPEPKVSFIRKILGGK